MILPDADVTQRSKFYSQFSPLDQNSALTANAPLINLDIRHSSSQRSLGIAPPFDKEGINQFDEDIPPMFGDEELPFADLGLAIDADGYFIEEPELPPHPVQQAGEEGHVAKKIRSDAQLPDDEAPIIHGDDAFPVIFDEEEQQLPAAAQIEMQNNEYEVPLPSEEALSSEPAQPEPAQPRQPKKRKRDAISADDATHVGRAEFREWSAGYMNRIKEAQDIPHKVTVAKAKENAYNLVFGMGIGDIGILDGIFNNIIVPNHELADLFSGEALKSRVPGYEVEAVVQGNRRRSASVAFESKDENSKDDRRVRPRVDEAAEAGQEQDQQAGRSQQDAQIDDDAMVIFGDDQDALPEAGRERAGSALSDHRRSSNAPWNRPSSAVPSSAAKNAEAGRHAVEGSPLVGRGSILQPPDVKFSDGGAATFGPEGFAPMQSDGANDFSSYREFGAAAGVSTQEANTSQFMRKALDREGHNFLGFVKRVAADRGQGDAEDESRRWVGFDGLFEEQDKMKTVVAQAFLHVLTLATKNQIKVTQDDVEDKIPFGEIRVGVAVDAEQAEQAEPDEQADEVDNMGDLEGHEEHEDAKERV